MLFQIEINSNCLMIQFWMYIEIELITSGETTFFVVNRLLFENYLIGFLITEQENCKKWLSLSSHSSNERVCALTVNIINILCFIITIKKTFCLTLKTSVELFSVEDIPQNVLIKENRIFNCCSNKSVFDLLFD